MPKEIRDIGKGLNKTIYVKMFGKDWSSASQTPTCIQFLRILLKADPDSVDLGWASRFCISNRQHPGDAPATGVKTILSVASTLQRFIITTYHHFIIPANPLWHQENDSWRQRERHSFCSAGTGLAASPPLLCLPLPAMPRTGHGQAKSCFWPSLHKLTNTWGVGANTAWDICIKK